MREAKNTPRALVRIGFDGKVHKTFRGPQARERYENEVRVLEFLEEQGCPYVPKVVEADPDQLYLVTTNCGGRVDRLSDEKRDSLFRELEDKYQVRHQDAEVRNITYRPQDGRFCIIDFEFAQILAPGYPDGPPMLSHPNRDTFHNQG
ncbi:MAG: serine/threonine protein phosphatase [Opitutales bacterium]